jgi:hypothetical protein
MHSGYLTDKGEEAHRVRDAASKLDWRGCVSGEKAGLIPRAFNNASLDTIHATTGNIRMATCIKAAAPIPYLCPLLLCDSHHPKSVRYRACPHLCMA